MDDLAATNIDRATALATLNSGLFESAGPDRFRFAHRTYGEFLAADTAERVGLSTPDVLGLLRHPDSGRVYPQLGEVAAWVADARDEVFDAILEREPELLLASDVATRDAPSRVRLALALLEGQDRIPAPRLSYAGVRRLASTDLVALASSWLRDAERGGHARRLAADLAAAIPEMASVLIDVVLDASEEDDLREAAARRLPADLGETDTARLTSALLQGPMSDELRGTLLTHLWPASLSLSDLLTAASHPVAQPVMHGAYRKFLTTSFAEGLAIAQLSHALQWALANAATSAYHAEAADVLILAALHHLEEPGIAATTAALLLARHRAGGRRRQEVEAALQGLAGATTVGRRLLLGSLIPMSDGSVGHRAMTMRIGRLADFGWAIEHAAAATSTREQDAWAVAAERWFQPLVDPEQLDILMAHVSVDAVHRTFTDTLDGVPFTGDEADAARAAYAEQKEWADRLAQYPDAEVVDLDRARAALRSDATSAWFELCDSLDPDPMPGSGIDVTALRGWQSLSEDERDDAAEAARRWLVTEFPPAPFEGGSWPIESIHALRGLRLVVGRDGLAFLDRWSDDQWTAWTRVLLGIAAVGASDDDAAIRNMLIERAHQRVPDSVRAALLAELDREAERARVALYAKRVEPEAGAKPPAREKPDFRYPTPLHAHTLVTHIWDDELTRVLLDWQVAQPDEVGMGETLAFLIDTGSSDALDVARSAVANEGADDALLRCAVAGAVALLTSKRGLDCWPDVWQRWERDEVFGRALVTRIGSGSRWELPAALAALQPESLAELYVWMQPRRAVHVDPIRDPFDSLCDAVLQSLQEAGSARAVAALRAALSAVPTDGALPYALQEAERRHREAAWSAPHVAELCALIVDPAMRFAASDSDLASAVVASIERAQRRLKQATPALSDVWDLPHDPALRRPKIEPDLSDWLKRHFEQDLPATMVNREVEITPGFKAAWRMRELDILVQALAPGEEPRRLEVIVENKGCWNRGLDTDIENQLVNTYLLQTQGGAGIYVVFTFDCIASGSKRCPSCSRRSADELRAHLEERANELTRSDLDVRAVVIEAGLPSDYPVVQVDAD